MHRMIEFNPSIRGLDMATETVNRVATQVAGSGFPGDQVDLSDQMVSLMSAKNDFEANVKAIQTEDQVNQSLLDITI